MKEEIRANLLDNDFDNNIINNINHLHKNHNNIITKKDEAIVVDTLNITPTLLLSTFFALLGSLSFGFSGGYTSPVQSEIVKELGLSTSEYSLFVSVNNIGSSLGAILCGKLVDYLGRRRALGLADVFYILGWFSIAVSQDVWLLDLGRFMLGISMAICNFAVPIYIAEFAPTNLRGGFVVLHVLMVTIGSSVAFLLGLIVPWRTLALIGSIPSIAQIIGIFFIPESPRWLMGYSSPVQSSIVKDLGLSTAQFSLFGSLLTVGGLLGASVCGKITDHFGRRATMGFSSLVYLTGWLTIACAQGPVSLDLGRLALGFANGIVSYAVPVYIAEITPKELRGGSVLLHQLLLCCGIAVLFLAGIVTSWQILALIGTIPCLIQLVSVYFIEESPRWLIKKRHSLELPAHNGRKNYKAVLQRLRGRNVDISEEADEIKAHTEACENNVNQKFSDVFQKKYAFALTVCLGLMVLSGLGGAFAILFYAKSTFESAGISGSVGSIAMGLIQLPPAVLGVLLMDKFGRRPLLMFSAAGMGIGTLSLAISFSLKEHGLMTDFSPYLALFGILLFSATFPVGMGGIPFVIMSEIFPINIKGAAGTLSTVVNFVTSWIVSYSFNFMMAWSPSGTFIVFTSANVCSLLFVAKLVPETKGRTLEEIQTSLMYK